MLADRVGNESATGIPAAIRTGLPPAGDAVDLSFLLGGRVFRVCGIPRNWRDLLPSRLLINRADPAAQARRVIHLQLSRRDDLRAPAEPHDLNETSELVFERDAVTYRSDWCEGRFSRRPGEQVRLLCHVDAGPWFGGVVENMLRVVVAYDVLERSGVMLHCAAIVRQGRAVGLFGHSGAGKSTSSALAMSRGCYVISDDINVIEPADSGWQVTPVPFSGTLNAASDIDRPVPLQGLFHLNKSDEVRVAGCSAARSVTLLAGSAPFVNRDPFAADRMVETLARLASEVPVHDLYFTRDAAFVDHVFGELP